MIKIIADSKIPFLQGALERYASISYLDGREIDRSAVKNADALIVRTRTLCNESLLNGSRVKFIATATIGFDHIATAWCNAHSVQWTNAPGCNSASVEQYIASVLANLAFTHDYKLAGKTLGIVGVGHVGKRVEALGRLLGMNVFLNDPPRERAEGQSGFVPLEKLLSESDVITLHVPLNKTGEDQSLHLINETTLKMLKPGSWLINSSRGEVVAGDALQQVLFEGGIGGAVLDVWENEPNVDLRLLRKVSIATPHIAGYSADGKRNGTVHAVRSLAAHFDLPLTTWEPSGMPEPENPAIILDGHDHSPEELVCRAILHTYNVMDDDDRFRASPGDFETLRGNYPVRREFPAFKIVGLNGSAPAKKMLMALGFG